MGDRIGRYLVLSALGAGGMGVVFAAYDPQLDRKIALKVLRGGRDYNTKDARARLRREAQAIAQLSHPNVVAAYDVGQVDGTLEDGDLYIAMEFVEGDTLTKWLKAYPRSWREIVDVFLQAARGLVAAHSVGLLHRDFKPDNVLVGGDGRVRVTDFGLARSLMFPAGQHEIRPRHATATALNQDLTATGTVLGTPRYMAPEQLRGPDIDARADQFSFSVALYEALYGAHPLPGATAVAMLEQNEKANPPPTDSAAKKIPATIARAVMRGLERDRARRFPSMAALISELVPPPARAPMRYAVVGAIAVVAVGTAAAAFLTRAPRDSAQPTRSRDLSFLITKLNAIEAERRHLLQIIEQQPTVAQLQELQTKLTAAEETIHMLVAQIQTTEAASLVTRPAAPRPPSFSELAAGSMAAVHRDLEGCFIEWNEREQGQADFRYLVVLQPIGVPEKVTKIRGPDSVSLDLCVHDNIARVRFTPAEDQLELYIDVGWGSGLLTTSGRVIGWRQVIDPRPDL